MITYYIIHRVKRVVLLETDCLVLLQAYVDQKVEIHELRNVEILIDKE